MTLLAFCPSSIGSLTPFGSHGVYFVLYYTLRLILLAHATRFLQAIQPFSSYKRTCHSSMNPRAHSGDLLSLLTLT